MRAFIIFASIFAAGAAEAKGPEAMAVFNHCQAEALKNCGRDTIRCRAYRKSFVKSCMIQADVDPAYIMLLTENN
jgi:hypothetical protein